MAECADGTGSVYRLGRHRIMCGNSVLDSHKRILLQDRRGTDIIMTDPPYSSGGWSEASRRTGSLSKKPKTKERRNVRNDTLSSRGRKALLREAMIPADHLLMFTDWRMWCDTCDIAESCSFPVRGMIVWDKTTIGIGLGFRPQHEIILYGTRLPQKTGRQSNVIQCKRTKNEHHTTEKPVELLEKLLANVSGNTVYDPFLGSGSTLIAAENAGKTCIGMELDQGYVDTAISRWEKLTGEKAKRIE